MCSVVFLGLPLIGFLGWCAIGAAIFDRPDREEVSNVHRDFSE